MTALVNLLDEKERRFLSVLATIFGCLFAALLVFGVRAALEAGRMAKRKDGIETSWNAADRARRTVVRDWERWTQGAADVGGLRADWFFDRAKGVQAMRLDLQQVLEAANVPAAEIAFAEAEVIKDRLRKVTVGFQWSGSYPAFRRILETIEAHPRALYIAKIDFGNIGMGPGFLEARFALEAYYVQE
jgi:succinate dehydrogenase/fumarate reductase flavoprotein subunit